MKNGKIQGCLCILLVCSALLAAADDDIRRLSFDPPQGMTRADLFYLSPERGAAPRAVLILCPGANGDGRCYLSGSKWRDYARRMGVGLVGLSFASEAGELKDKKNGKGYYYVSKASGELLLLGIRKIYGEDLPILIYGISGGAHFTARLVEWRPDRIVAWCAYSAGWWDKPARSGAAPPGIVACGADDERLDASLAYFWDGREKGKPWLWIDVEGLGHVSSPELEAFVMEYFEEILNEKGGVRPFEKGLWVDIYERSPLSFEDARHRPCAAAWLPRAGLYNKWILLTKGFAND